MFVNLYDEVSLISEKRTETSKHCNLKLPERFIANRRVKSFAIVMGVAHQNYPIFGVQYHPEAVFDRARHTGIT